MAVPVVGHEDPHEVGVAVEADAHQIERLALGEVRAGEHTGEVLMGMGYSTSDIETLKKEGIIE